MTVLIIAVLALGVLGFGTFFTVHQTQQALVLQFGEPKRVVQTPGLHFKIPLIQNVEYLDRRVLHVAGGAKEIIASDQKRLVVDAFLRYRITDPLLFFQSVRMQSNADARLQTIVESALREVLGAVPLNAIVSERRVELMHLARDVTALQAQNFGIEVIDVRIKRTDLPEENSQAIYARMRAEREREAREARALGAEEALRIRARADRDRTVLVAQAQKTADITRGEGDARAVRIYAEAYSIDPGFYNFYRTMQAYRESLQADDTTMVLSPDSEFFQFFGAVGTSSKLTPAPGPRLAAP
jgi:membrane protease subunit HflC